AHESRITHSSRRSQMKADRVSFPFAPLCTTLHYFAVILNAYERQRLHSPLHTERRMKAQLERLKELAGALEPGPEQRAFWAQMVMAHAERFLTSLPLSAAFRATEDEGKGILSSSLGEEPQDVELILKCLAEHVEKPGVKLGSPGYLAFIPVS